MKVASLADICRKDFPILQKSIHGHPLIYFDAAATSQKPKKMIEALTHFYTSEYGTVHRAIYDLAEHATGLYDKAREQVAQFIGAKTSDSIVFTRGTTESINLVAYNFRNKSVLLNEMEHHSNIVPWQLHGAKCSYLPVSDRAEICLHDLEKSLKEEVDLVSISHVANSTGTIHPIEEIIFLAHKYGAKVLIDAAQSASHMPLDVSQLDVDFLAFSSHKAFGPTGVGILYGKKEALEQLKPIQGGGDMIDQVTLKETIYAPLPLRLEAGTPPIVQVIGLGVAIGYMEELGIERIANWEKELTDYAVERLLSIPKLRLVGNPKNRSSIISFVVDGVHHLDLGAFLNLEGIAIRTGHHCAQPLMDRFGLTGTCRISFSPFNTIGEIDQCIDSLNRGIAQLS